MKKDQEKIIKMLIDKGQKLVDAPRKRIKFTDFEKADDLINNIEEYPHAFVLACVMDRQIKAEKAWVIPLKISEELGDFEFDTLLKVDLESYKRLFNKKKLHRFNNVMAENFYLAVQHIQDRYDGDASKIWEDKPYSEDVVNRMSNFKGVGLKISTMAANILMRDFKVPMKNAKGIEISPDVHVIRVFKRLGFISDKAGIQEVVEYARKINPDYPGIIDVIVWDLGVLYCHENQTKCEKCYLNKYCPSKVY